MGTEVYPAIEPQRKLGEVVKTTVSHQKKSTSVLVEIECEKGVDALKLATRYPIGYLFVEEEK